MTCFPFMIEMENKLCVIVGGGHVAWRKAQTMLSFGARVRLVAPTVEESIPRLQAESGGLELLCRPVQESDLQDADAVILATDDRALNHRYADFCKRRRIPVNVVDVKPECSFYFPAILRQGEVVVAVSTSGSSPALAAQIKQSIQQSLRPDYGVIAGEMAAARETILAQEPNADARREQLTGLLDEKLSQPVIRIGTRRSALARVQTELVCSALRARFPQYRYEIVPLVTQGDRRLDRPIPEFGTKAVFVEEFEQALLQGEIDLAVHSAKDMPNPCGEGLVIAGTLPRGPVQDVLVYRSGAVPDHTHAFVVGTSSLRRQYQFAQLYPNAVCQSVRGNVDTRLRRLREGVYDALILAAAGLERLGLHQEPDLCYEYLPLECMLPAAGQGVIAMETAADSAVRDLVQQISDSDTQRLLTVERAVLTELGAGCHEPVGVLAQFQGDGLHIETVRAGQTGAARRKVFGRPEEWQQLVTELCRKEEG